MKFCATRNPFNEFWMPGYQVFRYRWSVSVYFYWLGWQLHFYTKS